MSGCTNPLKISMENVFLYFPNHFFCSRNTLVLTEKNFLGGGKGEEFPCFQRGKWKICKLIEGKKIRKKFKTQREMFFPSCFKQLCLYGHVWAQQKGNCPCRRARCGSWATAPSHPDRVWVALRCHQGWLWGQSRGSCSLWPPNPSCSWFSLEGSLLLLPGCSGQAETRSHHPGCSDGSWRVRGCSQILIQSQS